MATRKQHGPVWSDVKRKIISLDQKQLVQLVGEFYRLSKENREFLHTRFQVGDDPLASYKKTIRESMYPDVHKDKPIEISKAKEAIRRYSKAVGDPLGEAELMTFFVECGNSFTVEYGDIDEDFYSALNLMYKRAIERVLSLPTEERDEFPDRLEEIMTSSGNIGWGYHDELHCDFYDAFPDDE